MSCNSVGSVFFYPARSILAMHCDIPPEIDQLMEFSIIGLMDSKVIIEDSLLPFAEPVSARVVTKLPDFAVLNAIPSCIQAINLEGFGPHASHFFGLLGSVMLHLTGDENQKEAVSDWVSQGFNACFAMTDSGGPLASQWTSVWDDEMENSLVVDKIWAMNATQSQFAIIIVRRKNSMALTPILLSPDLFRQAECKAMGSAFLDGWLPLGSIKLKQKELNKTAILGKGGIIAAKQFLAIARPWLIKALVAHIWFLVDKNRMRIDSKLECMLDFISNIATSVTIKKTFDRYSEDQAMAMKWVANEIWVYAIRNHLVKNMPDVRDLLSFTKIEGSSYRCFYEIYQRNKQMRIS